MTGNSPRAIIRRIVFSETWKKVAVSGTVRGRLGRVSGLLWPKLRDGVLGFAPSRGEQAGFVDG